MDTRVGRETERLFMAAVPDAETAARIHRLAGALRRAHGFMGSPIPADRLHVSLFFVGGLHEAGVDAAGKAVVDAAAVAPFHVSFDRTASFGGKPGNHPLVLCGDAGLSRLQSFRQSIAAAMMRRGLRQRANTNFTPHVTLLYGERRTEEHPVEPISWTVREIVLIRSLRGHKHVARWRLRER